MDQIQVVHLFDKGSHEHLEWAYQNRDELRSYGLQAGNDLKELTWKRCAEKFVEVVGGHRYKFTYWRPDPRC